jgi:hypothetical protein
VVTAITCERAGLPTCVLAMKEFISESLAIIRTRSVTDQPIVVLDDPRNRDFGAFEKAELKELVRKNFDKILKAIVPSSPEELKSVSVLEWARLYKA